ncbi:MAG: hypothetical protein FWE23_09765 [Chitinivibrionia bacterium]|nr:hypothetical protein [Chitinivibrionia bacterium]
MTFENITAVVGIIGVFIAIYQLSQANKQLKSTTLTNVLSLEAEMNNRKERLDSLNHDVEIERLNADRELSPEYWNIYEKRINAAVDSWLDAVNRLCFCIKKGYLTEKEWKAEYRNLITGVVEDFEDKFGEASEYTNIIDLNRKLRRE